MFFVHLGPKGPSSSLKKFSPPLVINIYSRYKYAMPTLAINTANSHTSIALLDPKGQPLGLEWESSNDEAEKLMPAIADLAKKSGYKLANINEVIVVKGPGSFTGLRVGVTVANTIAYLNKAKLYSVNTFEYLWKGAEIDGLSDGKNDGKMALLLYAGARGVYVSLSPKENFEKDVVNVNVEDLSEYLNHQNSKKPNFPKTKKFGETAKEEYGIERVFGDITADQERYLPKSTLRVTLRVGFAEIMAEFLKEGLKENKIVMPVYIKNPGITASKKQF